MKEHKHAFIGQLRTLRTLLFSTEEIQYFIFPIKKVLGRLINFNATILEQTEVAVMLAVFWGR